MKCTEPKNSVLSINNPSSYASSKKMVNAHKRNSLFVRVDFGKNLAGLNSKKSRSSFKKQSTLQSIQELPGEDKGFDKADLINNSKPLYLPL